MNKLFPQASYGIHMPCLSIRTYIGINISTTKILQFIQGQLLRLQHSLITELPYRPRRLVVIQEGPQ